MPFSGLLHLIYLSLGPTTANGIISFFLLMDNNFLMRDSLIAQSVKNLPAMQETQVRFMGWEDPLEKEMETHSGILTWKIPWAEEPGRLQSMDSRVRHDLATKPPPPPIISSGFWGGSVIKNLPTNSGDVGSILGLEDPLMKGMATDTSIIFLGNSMGRGLWWVMSMGTQLSKYMTVFHYVYIISSLPIDLWTYKLCPYFKWIIFKTCISICI